MAVGLSAIGYGLWAPSALAQQTCPAGQRYCPSGSYSGQCRTNTVTCATGSVAATVEGCSSCSCPSGQVVCGGACQVARQCPDANRATANQCAATNAASCGSCADGYGLNTATGLCEEVVTVVVAPSEAQVGNSDRSAVSVVQSGAGLLLNLQSQSGNDPANRKSVLTVDKTGVQVGWHHDTAKLGLDLSATGGQNIIYGVAKAAGMDAVFDALLLLQTKLDDGSLVNRLRIGREGNVIIGDRTTDPVDGIFGPYLIKGVAKYSGLSEAGAALLNLQTADDVGATTPRLTVNRDGNLRASGTVRGDAGLCIGGDCKSSWDAVAPPSVLLQDATPGTAQTGNFNLSGTGRVGSLVVNGGITAGGSVGIVGANGKIPAINSTYFTSLTGTSLTALNASNLAIGTVPDARLPSGLLQNPIDGGSGNVGPWLTIQGGGAVLSNTSLRLYDAGTAAANANILEFAHNGGSGPVAIARVKSANVDANAANGGVLALETASNNAGVWNAGQLTLYNNGRVGVGLTPGGPTP
ncbi:MAG: hypothetical protein Q8R16_05460, partial [bacterium]|nr:hypothetical protein [bacterium]